MFSIWLLTLFTLYIYRYFKLYRKRWSNWNIIIWVWALIVYTCVAACINLDEFIYFAEAKIYILIMQLAALISIGAYPWIHYHTIGDMTVPFWRHNYRNIWSFSILRSIFPENIYNQDLFYSWLRFQKTGLRLIFNYFLYNIIILIILFNGIFRSNNIFIEFFFYFINNHVNLGLSIFFFNLYF